jgi:hypothetical protein
MAESNVSLSCPLWRENSTETPETAYRNTWNHNPGSYNLNWRWRENLKYCWHLRTLMKIIIIYCYYYLLLLLLFIVIIIIYYYYYYYLLLLLNIVYMNDEGSVVHVIVMF